MTWRWLPTSACSECGGTGVVQGIGGRRVGMCGACLGDGGGRHWLAATPHLIALVHGGPDGRWRCKILFTTPVATAPLFAGRDEHVQACDAHEAILGVTWDSGRDARAGAQLAAQLMLHRWTGRSPR